MSSTMVAVGRHQVRVSDTDPRTGPDSGVPLLLLNGLGANLEMWEPLRGRLDRRTIAVDLPGTGGSPTPPLPLTIPQDARLVLGVLDALGVEAVDVLGFSFGGSIALELARLAPQRVRRLVLASTSCGWGGVPGSPLALALLSNPLRYYSPAFFKAVAPAIVGGQGARSQRFLDRQARLRAARPPTVRGYAYHLWAACLWTSLPWLHTLRQPTLLIAGELDQVTPAVNARIMACLLPAATLRTWPGGGHMLALDSASKVAPEIEGFLAA